MCRTSSLCFVGRDENDTIICVHGFSKINYKLFTYSEVGVIAL